MSGGKVFRSPASSATLRSLVMLSGASCPAEMAAEGSGHRALQGGAARGRLPSRTAVWLRRGRPRRLESLPAALFVVGDAEHAVLGPISSRNCSRGQIGGLLHSALPAASLPAAPVLLRRRALETRPSANEFSPCSSVFEGHRTLGMHPHACGSALNEVGKRGDGDWCVQRGAAVGPERRRRCGRRPS